MIIQTLSVNLKQLRQKKGWKQETIANALDISIPAYSKIENGGTDINLSRLEQIAELYSISLIELITGDGTADLNQLATLKDLLAKKDQEIIELQRLVIEFYKKQN